MTTNDAGELVNFDDPNKGENGGSRTRHRHIYSLTVPMTMDEQLSSDDDDGNNDDDEYDEEHSMRDKQQQLQPPVRQVSRSSLATSTSVDNEHDDWCPPTSTLNGKRSSTYSSSSLCGTPFNDSSGLFTPPSAKRRMLRASSTDDVDDNEDQDEYVYRTRSSHSSGPSSALAMIAISPEIMEKSGCAAWQKSDIFFQTHISTTWNGLYLGYYIQQCLSFLHPVCIWRWSTPLETAALAEWNRWRSSSSSSSLSSRRHSSSSSSATTSFQQWLNFAVSKSDIGPKIKSVRSYIAHLVAGRGATTLVSTRVANSSSSSSSSSSATPTASRVNGRVTPNTHLRRGTHGSDDPFHVDGLAISMAADIRSVFASMSSLSSAVMDIQMSGLSPYLLDDMTWFRFIYENSNVSTQYGRYIMAMFVQHLCNGVAFGNPSRLQLQEIGIALYAVFVCNHMPNLFAVPEDGSHTSIENMAKCGQFWKSLFTLNLEAQRDSSSSSSYSFVKEEPQTPSSSSLYSGGAKSSSAPPQAQTSWLMYEVLTRPSTLLLLLLQSWRAIILSFAVAASSSSSSDPGEIQKTSLLLHSSITIFKPDAKGNAKSSPLLYAELVNWFSLLCAKLVRSVASSSGISFSEKDDPAYASLLSTSPGYVEALTALNAQSSLSSDALSRLQERSVRRMAEIACTTCTIIRQLF